MAGKFLLDTNIVIALFNDEPKVKEKIDKAEEVFLPITVLGELSYGAINSQRKEKNLKRIQNFKGEVSILYTDDTTALTYGQVKKGLKDKGRPIPENDIWIAAIAMRYDLTLVSRDGHFGEIEGLDLITW